MVKETGARKWERSRKTLIYRPWWPKIYTELEDPFSYFNHFQPLGRVTMAKNPCVAI
jgi:hypothetical protein